ncbi:hypothetical protein T492DRAFT_1119946, partial [Pavlovales sp. CCMP2436]
MSGSVTRRRDGPPETETGLSGTPNVVPFGAGVPSSQLLADSFYNGIDRPLNQQLGQQSYLFGQSTRPPALPAASPATKLTTDPATTRLIDDLANIKALPLYSIAIQNCISMGNPYCTKVLRILQSTEGKKVLGLSSTEGKKVLGLSRTSGLKGADSVLTAALPDLTARFVVAYEDKLLTMIKAAFPGDRAIDVPHMGFRPLVRDALHEAYEHGQGGEQPDRRLLHPIELALLRQRRHGLPSLGAHACTPSRGIVTYCTTNSELVRMKTRHHSRHRASRLSSANLHASFELNLFTYLL